MNNEPLEREPMNNEPLEHEPIDRMRAHEPIDRVRARLEALLKANAAPRCGARSKRKTVAPAGGNTCAPRSVRLDLRAPAVLRSDTVAPDHLSRRTDWHRCQWQGRRGLPRAGGFRVRAFAEGFRAQGVADAFASPGAEVD
jgi:hypothetical protein